MTRCIKEDQEEAEIIDTARSMESLQINCKIFQNKNYKVGLNEQQLIYENLQKAKIKMISTQKHPSIASHAANNSKINDSETKRIGLVQNFQSILEKQQDGDRSN
jgi:hypothetical protein